MSGHVSGRGRGTRASGYVNTPISHVEGLGIMNSLEAVWLKIMGEPCMSNFWLLVTVAEGFSGCLRSF